MSTDYSSSSDLFFDELLRVSSSIVWKNPTLALRYESDDEAIEIEQYTLARQGRLTFNTIHEFSEDVLRSLNLSEEMVVNCQDDSSQIPSRLRNRAVELQAQWQLDHYVEKNNYYRMLHGLPDVEDTSFFYNTDYPDISDSMTPIHELNQTQIRQLEANGYIEKLLKENPSKKYLDHMTDKKIDIYKARNSKPFAILWITDSDSDNMVEDFMDTYAEARGMIMAVFYQRMMSQGNAEYTGFIGMMILFQTIMLMQKNFLDADITRDFYDVESLRLVYDSYDVPFYQNLPLEHHKKIVKNVNILLSHKGSTRVFYDLFDIFGFSDIAMYSFYMVKKRKFDVDGKPVIVKDENGNVDRQKMYEIDFAKVPLYGDPLIEIRNPRNKVRYSELTVNDQYWIDDKDLLEKIFNEEFNYMESKYIGLQLTSNLMQIIYETTYYLKLILDNRTMLSATTIYNSSMHTNMNIFDMVIYLSALITKKYGFEGNIPHDPHEIGAVMGFNFKLDLEVLKNNIKDDPYLRKDKHLFMLLETMDVNSLASVKKVYNNLTTLRKYLVKKMSETDEVDEYWAYRELHDTIMYSEYTESTFMKSNGDMATSFADLLSDINPTLYNRYTMLDNIELSNEVVDMLYLMKNSCNSLKYIQYTDSVNIDTIIEYLFKLLDFFKSAKADLTGYEIVYSLISSADNIIKMMCYIDRINDDYTEQPIYSIIDELACYIAWIKDRMELRDKYKLIDEMNAEFHTSVLESITTYLDDYIAKCVEEFYAFVDQIQMMDYFSDHKEITLLPTDPLEIKDDLFVVYEELKEILKFHVFDEFPILDEIIKIIEKVKDLTVDEKFEFVIKIATLYERSKIGESKVTFKDAIKSVKSIEFVETERLLVDTIIQIYKKHNHIDVSITTEDFLNHIRTNTQIDEESILKDVDPQIEEIFLIIEDYHKNRYKYMDEIENIFFTYYTSEDISLKEKVSVFDQYERFDFVMPYLISYIKAHRDITKLVDEFTFEDEIALVFVELMEDFDRYRVHVETSIADKIIRVYEKQYKHGEQFEFKDRVRMILMLYRLGNVSFPFEDVLPFEEDFTLLIADLCNNPIRYECAILQEYTKLQFESEIPFKDELLSWEFMRGTSIFPPLKDKIESEKDKIKTSGSHVQWEDRLYLVYEETFE